MSEPGDSEYEALANAVREYLQISESMSERLRLPRAWLPDEVVAHRRELERYEQLAVILRAMV